MRKTLFAAAALAPLWMAATAAQAQTLTISASQTTPVATATAVSSAPADITIASGGAVQPTTASAPAVTLNSNNTVTNQGTIQFKDVDNAIGVQVNGGFTGALNNSAIISVTDSRTATDTNSDGVVEAPFASGSGRYGVRVVGPGTFTGSISNLSGGSITAKGDNSFGLSVETALNGSITNAGTITVTGVNGTALRTTAPVSGSVLLTGGVSSLGQGSNAVSLGANVAGRLSVYSSVNSSGYGSSTRPSTAALINTVQSTASEVQQGGSALIVGGDVGGGIYIGAQPANTASGSTADVDGDGIADGSQSTGAVTSFGSAPGMVIGSTTRSVTIAPLVLTTANPYGLIVAGSVAGAGIYDGVTSTGLQVGATGQTANIQGGVKISGTVAATSYGATATGLHVLSGGSTPTLTLTGNLTATSDQPNTTTTTPTPYSGTATALLIDAGGSLTSITNSGTLGAAVVGDTASASAVVDRSGTLSSITNTGKISAAISAATSGQDPQGRAIALDLSANTSGVTLVQSQAPNVTTTSSTGTTTTTTPAAPTIVGDVLLGAGPNSISLLAGSMTGGLSLGSGVSALTISNGATYTGALTYTGSALTLNVNSGTLQTTSATTLNASSLNIGSSGVLVFAVDPVNSTATKVVVSGTANLAAGAKLGVDLRSNLTTAQSYTLIQAGTLTSAAPDATLLSTLPYLLFGATTTNTSAGTLTLDLRRKTAAEMGLNPSQGAALSAVYAALPNDSAVQSAFLAQTTKAGFTGLYNQVLPDYAGGTFQAARQASLAVGRATGAQNGVPLNDRVLNAWGQQIFFGIDQDRGDTNGFRGHGFGFVAGVDSHTDGFGVLGLTAALLATTVRDRTLPGDSQTDSTQLEGGVYWQGTFGRLVADARGSVGYISYKNKRQLVFTDSSGVSQIRKAESDGTGYSLSAHGGLSYQFDFKPFYVRPQVSADYFRLDQGGYTNSTGGGAFALTVSDRTGDASSALASVVFGTTYGRDTVWKPELELGYRETFSGTAGNVKARFTSGGSTFTLTPQDITGGAGVARIRLRAINAFYEVSLDAGGEVQDGYKAADIMARISVRF